MTSTPDKVLMTTVTLLHCYNSSTANIETETTSQGTCGEKSYRKVPKFLDTRKLHCNHPKTRKKKFYH